MFHPGTQRLIDDWRRRRGDEPAPRRADFSPAALGGLMPQLFMLSEDDSIRLVGGLIADLHRRDLRGLPFASLWRPGPDAHRAAAALDEARTGLEPVVIGARAHTLEGYETRLEIALAPMAGEDGRIERILGLYQPVSSLARLAGKPVDTLSFRSLTPAEGCEPLWLEDAPRPRLKPALKLVALDGRRVA